MIRPYFVIIMVLEEGGPARPPSSLQRLSRSEPIELFESYFVDKVTPFRASHSMLLLPISNWRATFFGIEIHGYV